LCRALAVNVLKKQLVIPFLKKGVEGQGLMRLQMRTLFPESDCYWVELATKIRFKNGDFQAWPPQVV
jgi:hypothetical protein